MIAQIFAKRLKIHRAISDISQKELAVKAGLSQSTVAQIENGRMDPSLKTAEKLAEALGVQVTTMLTDFEIKNVS